MKSDERLSKNLHKLMRGDLESQLALSRAAGVSQSTIHRILKKKGSASLDTVDRLAKALSVEPVDLLNGSPKVALQHPDNQELGTGWAAGIVRPKSELLKTIAIEDSPYSQLFWSSKGSVTAKKVIDVALSRPNFELIVRCAKDFGINNVDQQIEKKKNEFSGDVYSKLKTWLITVNKGYLLARKDKATI